MAKTRQIAVRLDPATKAGIERAAAADGRSVSGLVARIVAQWLAQNGPFPLARGTKSVLETASEVRRK